MGIERRKFPRFPCRLAAIADGPRGPLRGTCTNLSRGGLYVEGFTLPLSAVVSVTLSFPSGPARYEMTVRRVTEEPRGVGLELMRAEPAALEALQAHTSPDE